MTRKVNVKFSGAFLCPPRGISLLIYSGISHEQNSVQTCSKPTLRLLLHLILLLGLNIIILVFLHVAVHSELLHLVWVVVTLLTLQDCVSFHFHSGGVTHHILVLLSSTFIRKGDSYEKGKGRLFIVLNSKLNSVFRKLYYTYIHTYYTKNCKGSLQKEIRTKKLTVAPPIFRKS